MSTAEVSLSVFVGPHDPSDEARARGATASWWGGGKCHACGSPMHEIDAPECDDIIAACDADPTHVEEWLPWPG